VSRANAKGSMTFGGGPGPRALLGDAHLLGERPLDQRGLRDRSERNGGIPLRRGVGDCAGGDEHDEDRERD
jgi:hypothetical protein